MEFYTGRTRRRKPHGILKEDGYLTVEAKYDLLVEVSSQIFSYTQVKLYKMFDWRR